MKRDNTVVSDFWQPQPKQYKLLQMCGLDQALTGGDVHEAMTGLIGYGGAAGGGKTEGMVALAMIAVHEIPGVKIGYFRRTFKELEGSDGPIDRAYMLYPQIGGEYNKEQHVWKFGRETALEGDDWNEGGASALRFCHCQHEKDVTNYQSSAFDILLFDEATHFTWSIVKFLLTRNRVSGRSQIPRPFAVMCSNPGGVGHMWYKMIFGIGDNIRVKKEDKQDGIS